MTGILSIISIEWLAGAAVAVIGLAGTWFLGRKTGKTAVKLDNLKSEVKAHDRINKADLGLGATDDDRIRRLREFAKRHGN